MENSELPLIARNLRRLREAKGYTQEYIAKVLQIDRSTYSYYEIGKTEPGLAAIKRLMELYRIEFDELFR